MTIQGYVTHRRQAIVPLSVRGTNEPIPIEAVLDTGFTGFLTLPPSLVKELELPFRDFETSRLAGGAMMTFFIYDVYVQWGAQELIVPVHAADGDILLGMALMQGCRITVDAWEGGRVAIGPAH